MKSWYLQFKLSLVLTCQNSLQCLDGENIDTLQGDRIGWFFLEKNVVPKKWWCSGLLFAPTIFWNFHSNKKFQNMVCCGCLNVSKVWMFWTFKLSFDVLNFQIQLWCRYFGVFWILFLKLGYFHEIFWVILPIFCRIAQGFYGK
jgi:hypothetical protein